MILLLKKKIGRFYGPINSMEQSDIQKKYWLTGFKKANKVWENWEGTRFFLCGEKDKLGGSWKGREKR